MGLFDSLLGSVLGGNQNNNALAQLASGLITNHGSGQGLAGLVQQFQQKGLGDLVQSWVGTGQNAPVSADQIQHALGSDQIAQMAQQTGLAHGDVASALAQMLPQLINHATPDGTVPPHNQVQDLLGGLLGKFAS